MEELWNKNSKAWKTNSKRIEICSSSEITLNGNGLSFLIKRKKVAEWILKQVFKMIELYAIYKKLSLNPKIQIENKRI